MNTLLQAFVMSFGGVVLMILCSRIFVCALPATIRLLSVFGYLAGFGLVSAAIILAGVHQEFHELLVTLPAIGAFTAYVRWMARTSRG